MLERDKAHSGFQRMGRGKKLVELVRGNPLNRASYCGRLTRGRISQCTRFVVRERERERV